MPEMGTAEETSTRAGAETTVSSLEPGTGNRMRPVKDFSGVGARELLWASYRGRSPLPTEDISSDSLGGAQPGQRHGTPSIALAPHQLPPQAASFNLVGNEDRLLPNVGGNHVQLHRSHAGN